MTPLRLDPDSVRAEMRRLRAASDALLGTLARAAKDPPPDGVTRISREVLAALMEMRYALDSTASSLDIPLDEALDEEPPDMAALVPDIIDIQEVGS